MLGFLTEQNLLLLRGTGGWGGEDGGKLASTADYSPLKFWHCASFLSVSPQANLVTDCMPGVVHCGSVFMTLWISDKYLPSVAMGTNLRNSAQKKVDRSIRPTNMGGMHQGRRKKIKSEKVTKWKTIPWFLQGVHTMTSWQSKENTATYYIRIYLALPRTKTHTVLWH